MSFQETTLMERQLSNSCFKFNFVWLVVGLMLTLVCSKSSADSFSDSIQRILNQYCITCHSTEKVEGELDLERFSTVARAKADPTVWLKVLEQLANKEMPPKDSPQLSSYDATLLRHWSQAMLDEVAMQDAGDPGPVVLRRLSNFEYVYTIQDLTGLPMLDPSREFPIDGAAGEGFTNAGAALVMSPSLLAKYLDAAKEVANHAVLVPDGIRFSPSVESGDWTDESIASIRKFYSQFTESNGASAVDLQGVKFETNAGGRLPVKKYLLALLAERNQLTKGMSTNDVAIKHNLNAKYVTLLWKDLVRSTATSDSPASGSLVLDQVRKAFWSADTTEADCDRVVALIQAWQQSLWRFASVGHIGKVDGPKAWQESTDPIVDKHEMRIKLAKPLGNSTDSSSEGDNPSTLSSLYLIATDAGDGIESDVAIWETPRLVTPGMPDVLLKDIAAQCGIDPTLFGNRQDGTLVDKASVCTQAPSSIELRIPASMIQENMEFVVQGRLHPMSGLHGSVQMEVRSSPSNPLKDFGLANFETVGLQPSQAEIKMANGLWSENNLLTGHSKPVILNPNSDSTIHFRDAFDEFRSLFPVALCYNKIVPVDEVVTLQLLFREDERLQRLMLNELEIRELNRLWDELIFVSKSPLKQVDVFEQLYQFATQDANPSAFEPLRQPIAEAAEMFQQKLTSAEPLQLQAVLDFASRAWRRPIQQQERSSLTQLHQSLRAQGLPQPESIHAMIARVLVAPTFLYRCESTSDGKASISLNDWELASRLSYFLWASMPDQELRVLADQGRLRAPSALAEQIKRMLQSDKVRRLSLEFGCQWLHVRDLDTLDEKSERHFPTFRDLRDEMREESVRFMMDLFQEDRSILSLLNADHTFVNNELAVHYNLVADKNSVPNSSNWRRVEGMQAIGRGGILGFASTLAKQSGASRTSPILRGNWVSEVLLGERLPRPPKGVPVLPEEAPNDLSERQLIERHSSDAKCASCHERIDPFGFALEGFDAIGRSRSVDSNGIAIDSRTHLKVEESLLSIEGIDGLRSYLSGPRRDDFVRQFCRKILGYALGRSVQLSDKLLIDSMMQKLQTNDYRVSAAIELIVTSPQFQQIRGKDQN
jgi:hypothetical protein